MAASRGPVFIMVALCILCLAILGNSLAAHASPSAPAIITVPTKVCSCAAVASQTASGTVQHRDQITPLAANYDEQIGLTFTQSFTSLQYNVTAVEQTDPTVGDGPAYLLNGLSNTGYWYQVGLSWNWGPGQNPGTGFDMNYEVFDPAGNSVYPTQGGGLSAFSGPVNAGDTILLNMYFSNAGHDVVMLAKDTNTGASASVSYSNEGASYFTGLPGSLSNTNGFFTGLMTEWYHGAPYYANEAEVIFSNPETALSSAWMWMDEFNVNTFQSVFSANALTPVSYNGSTRLQEFSFNGTTEYSDAYEFVTGALTNMTQRSSIPLTLSFSVQGGGSGYSAPVLTYVSNGTQHTTQITGSPTVYDLDAGSNWSISAALDGSSASERWETDQTTSGTADSPQTVQFQYYYQDYVTFNFSVVGGGTGYSAPTVTYTAFGGTSSAQAGSGVWVDAGSRYNYSNPLPGSTSSERWLAIPNGTLDSLHQIDVVYYHQYLVNFDISFKNTDVLPPISLRSTSAGEPYSATIIIGTNREWLDLGANYSIPQSYSLESGERLITNGTSTGQVSANLTVSLVYLNQFYVEIAPSVSSGGSVSPQSGWYDSGSMLQLDAAPASRWQFEGWEGLGADSVSGSTPLLSMTVGPGTPANETAVFYPGVTIDADGPISVSYQDGPISGSVQSGKTTQIYVPPSSRLSLTASGAGVLVTFIGWSGASNTSSTGASLMVDGPLTITAISGYNYLGITAIALVGAIILIAAVLVLRRWSRV